MTALTAATINPLKQNPFYAIPKYIADSGLLNDAEFVLMSRIYSAFGNDGWIEFKVSTLARMCNKGLSTIERLIASCRKKGVIKTRSTGRSLRFYLLDPRKQKHIENTQKKDFSKPREKPPQNQGVALSSRKESFKTKPQTEKKPPVADADSFESYTEKASRFKSEMSEKIRPSVSVSTVRRGLEGYGWEKLKWMEQRALTQTVQNPVKYFCWLINNNGDQEFEREKTRECENQEIAKQQRAVAGLNQLTDILKGVL